MDNTYIKLERKFIYMLPTFGIHQKGGLRHIEGSIVLKKDTHLDQLEREMPQPRIKLSLQLPLQSLEHNLQCLQHMEHTM